MNIVDARICRSEERTQIIAVGFLIRLRISLHKICEESFGFILVLVDFVFNFFLHSKFFLNFGLITAIDENAFPLDLINVEVDAFTIHHIVLPVTLVGGAIRIDHLAFAAHLPINPLATIHRTRCECVFAVAVHLVINPVTIELFLALATNTSVDSFTVSMFHLAATNGFPVSLVGGLVSILEFSKTESGDFLLNRWCFLDRRGRNDIFGLSSFFHLKLN